jgi:hypothetical protein
LVVSEQSRKRHAAKRKADCESKAAFSSTPSGHIFFSIASDKNRDYIATVPERDENTGAVRNVERATDSKPIKRKELLESEELKRKLRKAKNESEESEESA